MEQPKITTTPGKYTYSAPAKPTKDGDRGSMIMNGVRVEGAVSICAIADMQLGVDDAKT